MSETRFGKKINDIDISGTVFPHVWVDIRVEYNQVASGSITLKSLEQILDLRYALDRAIDAAKDAKADFNRLNR